MDIHFIKLQCCGNDFILLDGIKHAIPDEESLKELARNIVKEHFGVGGQGFLIVHKTKDSTVGIRSFDVQGKEAHPDSDAVRCAGRYLYDTGQLGGDEQYIETKIDRVRIAMVDSENVTVDMGVPKTRDAELVEGVRDPESQILMMNDKKYSFLTLDLGEKHAVFFVADYDKSFVRLTHHVKRHPGILENVQVNLAKIFSRNEIRIRTWHVKTGELLSSAASAGATVVASVCSGLLDREAVAHNRGGDIFVTWEETGNHIFSTAPVNYVFMGTYYWETWEGML